MKKNNLTAEEIKKLVSVEQVLSLYGIEYRGQRIPCPIHNGENKNFSVQGEIWHCFTCGETGDIFYLVQLLSKCDFAEAKKIICDNFNLRGGNKKEYKKKLVKLDEERLYKSNLKKIHNYQQIRISETLQALKGTFAEKHLQSLLEHFRHDKDFILLHDIHAHLTALLQRYGAYNPMIIITNEQTKSPFTFEKEQYQLAYNEKACLTFGDYSLKGLENEICIIAKSLDELIAMLANEKADYWEQAKRFKFCALVLMCSINDIRQRKNRQQILNKLLSLPIQYSIYTIYADNKQGAEYITYNFLEKYLFEKQEQLEKNIAEQ